MTSSSQIFKIVDFPKKSHPGMRPSAPVIPGSEIYFYPDFLYPLWDKKELFESLVKDTPWRQEEITLWGKTMKQPRLTAWYGDYGSRYSYSGLSLDPLPWTACLAGLRTLVSETMSRHFNLNLRFNSVLLNYYRDGQDSIGFHSDNEPELGREPYIASVSLGETRTIVFKPKKPAKAARYELDLPSGSLLLMKGKTQELWDHGINKTKEKAGARINLTFRYIVTHESPVASNQPPKDLIEKRRKWLTAAEAYYLSPGDDTGMTDHEWDRLARELYNNRALLPQCHILNDADYKGGSLYWVKSIDYAKALALY